MKSSVLDYLEKAYGHVARRVGYALIVVVAVLTAVSLVCAACFLVATSLYWSYHLLLAPSLAADLLVSFDLAQQKPVATLGLTTPRGLESVNVPEDLWSHYGSARNVLDAGENIAVSLVFRFDGDGIRATQNNARAVAVDVDMLSEHRSVASVTRTMLVPQDSTVTRWLRNAVLAWPRLLQLQDHFLVRPLSQRVVTVEAFPVFVDAKRERAKQMRIQLRRLHEGAIEFAEVSAQFELRTSWWRLLLLKYPVLSSLVGVPVLASVLGVFFLFFVAAIGAAFLYQQYLPQAHRERAGYQRYPDDATSEHDDDDTWDPRPSLREHTPVPPPLADDDTECVLGSRVVASDSDDTSNDIDTTPAPDRQGSSDAARPEPDSNPRNVDSAPELATDELVCVHDEQ